MKYLSFFAMSMLAIVILSCGTHNPFTPQNPSTNAIGFSEDKIPLEDGDYIYRQQIMAPEARGGNLLYSYRLTTLSQQIPENLYLDPEGWIYFHTPGTDSTIPLSEPGAHRQVWTSQATLQLDFTSIDGVITNLVTAVEIRIKHTDNQILSFSSAFRTNRLISSRISVPFANGGTTGQGVEFGLHEMIGDIFVEGLSAHHFMYRINEVNAQQEIISAGAWHSSLDCLDIRKVRLSGISNPALMPCPDGRFRQFESYVVSRQGIEEAGHHTVYFKVQIGFAPQTLIYPQTLAGLGQYHYSRLENKYIYSHELIPTSSNWKNKALWQDYSATQITYEAINSGDFVLHLQWGYEGEYGIMSANGNIITDGASPFDRQINICLDAVTHQNYFSKVAYFDLRLDYAPFPALHQFVNPSIQVDNDGTSWLRVRNINDKARHALLSHQANGIHLFEARAVDLAGIIDSSPAVVRINLHPYKDTAVRSGILLLDDSIDHPSYSPGAYVNSFYASAVPTNWGGQGYYELKEATNHNEISPITLMNYKAVVWYSDSPNQTGYLQNNIEALDIYLNQAGKLLLSSTHKLANTFENMRFESPGFVQEHFGIMSPDYYAPLSQNMISNTFCIGGDGMENLPDIELNLENGFNSLVSTRQGLSTVTYFRPGTGLDYIYSFACKLPTAAVYPPTQAQYELYSSQYLAYRHTHNTSSVVVFGFPLSYMQQTDVSQALTSILNEMINGRSK